jgi:ABC-type sugar transport system ATPase subunit
MLRMVDVRMEFPGVVALDGVSFELRAGEIHAILGQNGAGKSTLMKILAGEYAPTHGRIELRGEAVDIANPRAARRRRIAIVHQELSVLGNLTVAENVCLGDEAAGRLRLLDRRADDRRTADLLRMVGSDSIRPDQRVDRLTLAERQIVEIAKALGQQPEILVLDEPTASLSEAETERLLALLGRLREQGLGVVFITHRLREVTLLCDRATILRNGRVIATVDVRETAQDELIALILGEALAAEAARDHVAASRGEVALEIRGLVSPEGATGVSLDVREGEVYGLTGLLGAGQDAVARALFGIAPVSAGTVRWRGERLHPRSPRQAIRRGIGFLPEDRRGASLLPDRSVRENLTLPSLDRFARAGGLGVVRRRAERRAADELVARMRIVAPSASTPIRTLSGGNQQKALLARWLLRDSELLVLQEPTHGVDVGARRDIHAALRGLAADGRAVLVVSAEVSELLTYADRVGVMHGGRLVAELPASASEAEVQAAVQGGGEAVLG